ncbi:MAG TPA: dihydrofolate reductase family protein [Gaiellaceae bacterium]|jgi:dihydrofolate reductase|nr:dihydrofolate reductase family protein [Gaiellaceae bacterium]
MRRIVVSEFVTLDGVMEDPGGSEKTDGGGWAFRFERGPEGDAFKLDELLDAEGLLLGRTTYDGFAAAWPTMQDEAGFADRMNSMPKYVVSSTLEDPSWNNTTVLGGDAIEAVRRLKAEDGGNLLVAGSCRLVHALLANDLVDDLRLMVYPVVLGRGKRLFPDASASAAFELVETAQAGQTALLTLRRQTA